MTPGRVGAPAHIHSHTPADLRPGIEPTNKISQKMHQKSIIRAVQKAQHDVNVARAPLAGEQRNITAHLFVPFMPCVFLNFRTKSQTMKVTQLNL